MRGVRLFSAALLVVASLAVPSAARAATPGPESPYRAVTMNAGNAGAREYQGSDVRLDHLTSEWAGFSVPDRGSTPGGQVTLSPPSNATLAPGTYAVAPNHDATHGLLYLGTESCFYADSGSYTITEFSGTGQTAVFAADYAVTCDDVPFTGSIRWNSAADFRAAEFGPALTELGTVDIGKPVDTTVTFTSRGSVAPTLGAATVESATPATFSVVQNTCDGQTIAYGASCTLVVRAAPLVVSQQRATVHLAGDGNDPYAVVFTLTSYDPIGGTYYPTTPQRVLDTRSGIGIRKGPIGPAQTWNFFPLRFAYQKASAVVLNVTVDRPTTAGYVTFYPGGTVRPHTSSLNFTRGWTGANLVTVPLRDIDQRVAVFNSAGATNVIADVVGYYGDDASDDHGYPRGGGYHPTNVQRILDTRTAGFGKLKGGYYVNIPVRYQSDGHHIAALSVTVTAVNMTSAGYLTTWNGYGDAPYTSTLNFAKNSGVVSNAAVVPTSYCPPLETCNANAYMALLNQGGGPVDVIVDINGYYDDGNLPADVRFRPLKAPTRIVDSRTKLGTTRFGPNTTHTITAPTSVAGIDTIALDANVTAVAPTLRTFLTVWPKFTNYPKPTASVLNPLARQTVADHVVAEVGYGNLFNVYNAIGSTDVLMDVDGTFELFPPTPSGTAAGAAPHAAVARPSNVAGAVPSVHGS